MPAADSTRHHWSAALCWALAGAALVLGAWAMPVYLTAVTPALLARAGQGTQSAAQYGRQFAAAAQPGPAALMAAAAREAKDPRAAALDEALAALRTAQPALVPWGGRDPFLDPLMRQPGVSHRPAESTPVLSFFVTGKARDALRGFLANSRSPGVTALLATREVGGTTRFVPANKPGGQATDAVILLTALLYQGEHLSPSLQRELRDLADQAVTSGKMGQLEETFLGLLSLGRRLDWIQLCTLMRVTGDARTLREVAGLLRTEPDALPVVYAGALMAGSADNVIAYLSTHGRDKLDDIRLAIGHGQGAVRQLLSHRVPVNRRPGPAPDMLASLGYLQPRVALALKYLGWFLGAFCLLRALDRAALGAGGTASPANPHLKAGALALIIAGLFVAATEPLLIRPPPPPSNFQLRLAVPIIGALADPSSLTEKSPSFAMDLNSLLSIGFFAGLQVAVYLVCLAKIRSIDRLPFAPLVKLRLMENEENLFDGGLYVGIGGTATALVLQVLGVIDPNLLAAYSSNLFGITCVALVKIRHVRPYKNKLILEGMAANVTSPAAAAATTA